MKDISDAHNYMYALTKSKQGKEFCALCLSNKMSIYERLNHDSIFMHNKLTMTMPINT